MAIAKETFKELLYNYLEYLGEYMTINDMVNHTKYYRYNNFLDLINDGTLSSKKKN